MGVSKVITTDATSITFRWKENDKSSGNHTNSNNIKFSQSLKTNISIKTVENIDEETTHFVRIFATQNTVTTINSESEITKRYTTRTIKKNSFGVENLNVLENLSAIANSSSQITLTWRELVGVAGYQIYRYTTADFSDIPKVYKIEGSSITSYIDNADLTAGMIYYYKLTLISKTTKDISSKIISMDNNLESPVSKSISVNAKTKFTEINNFSKYFPIYYFV